MNTERIIEAVRAEFGGERNDIIGGYVPRDVPLTTALVNLAMSGACPECGGRERRVWSNLAQAWYDPVPNGALGDCTNPYHDHREALEALLAERG